MDKEPGWRKRMALELNRSIKHNKAKIHSLQTLYWQCTERNNQSEPFQGHDRQPALPHADMPLADFLPVVDEMLSEVDQERFMVMLTGGEPLLRSDIALIGRELTSRGVRWGLVTNGQLLDKPCIDTLRAAGMQRVSVALDGFEEAHNTLHGEPPGYEMALNALCLLGEEEGLDWQVTTQITSLSFPQLALFKAFLTEMGATHWIISALLPTCRTTGLNELALSDEQFTKLLHFIRACRQEKQLHVGYACEGFLGNFEGEVRDEVFLCRSGVTTATVRVDGAITGCPEMHPDLSQGSIYKAGFREVWNHGFAQYRDRGWSKKGICAECKMFRFCEGNGMHFYTKENELTNCHYRHIL